MKRLTQRLQRQRSSRRLVRIALRFWGNDQAWHAISCLQERGSPATLEIARALASSLSWRKRSLGLLIASQLRKKVPNTSFGSVEFAPNETQMLLLSGLHDSHSEVLDAAISGFGHRPHPDALPRLVELSLHSNASTRLQVAIALGRYIEDSSITTLMRMARDADSDVRDWATFGLGTLQDVDTPEVREVLWTNLHDNDSDVRGEALVGLAKRKDMRVTDYLLEHLHENCQVYEIEAAELLADPRLLASLRQLATANGPMTYWRTRLDSAIGAISAILP